MRQSADVGGSAATSDRRLGAAPMPIGMAQVALDGRWMRVNAYLCDITGYSEPELLSLTVEAITHPDDLPATLQINARLHGGEIDCFTSEKRYIHKNGSPVWVRIVVSLVRDPDTGEPRHSVAMIEDIDQSKRAQKALLRRTEWLSLQSQIAIRLLDGVDPDQVLADVFRRLSKALDLDVYIHYRVAEESALRLAGHGGLPAEIIAQVEQLKLNEAVCGTVAVKRMPIFANDVQHSSDPKTTLIRSLGITAYACHPLMASGRLVGTISFGSRRVLYFDLDALTVMRTICDQLAMAIVRRDAEREARAAREVAERAMVAKAKFLASASHDLRQPIQSLMLLNGALVGWANGKPAALKLLEHQETSLNTLKDLLDSLLDISRLDAGAIKPEIIDVPVMTLFARLQATYGTQAQARQLRLSLVPSNAWVRTDATLLGRILSNLIENAIKYNKAGGRILVGCRQRGNRLRIVVADSGIGIASERTQEIFDEFKQINNPNQDRTLGLGLGLAIVKRLAALLGLEVNVRSTLGKGSMFSLEVPLSATTGVPTIRSVAAKDRGQGSGIIALIEDEVMIRAASVALLTEWGYEVVAGGSIAEVQEALQAYGRRPHLLLSDYHLSDGANGVQAIEAFQAAFGADLPCILVTGDTAPERLAEAKRSGFNLLKKPTTSTELHAAIRKARGYEAGGSSVDVLHGGSARYTSPIPRQ